MKRMEYYVGDCEVCVCAGVCVNECAADSFTQTVVAFSSFVFFSDGFIFHCYKLEIGSFLKTKRKK